MGSEIDDLLTCEHCLKATSVERCQRMSDVWICDDCYATWKKEFDACEHRWEPDRNEFGEAGRYCEKCSGFVVNEPA